MAGLRFVRHNALLVTLAVLMAVWQMATTRRWWCRSWWPRARWA
jgi:hypothetical protein